MFFLRLIDQFLDTKEIKLLKGDTFSWHLLCFLIYMMKMILFSLFLFLLAPTSLFASNAIKISPFGKSLKGQFIAYEEYGVRAQNSRPFVRFKIMNVWKNKYVFQKEVVGRSGDDLQELRMKTRINSKLALSKYYIRPI